MTNTATLNAKHANDAIHDPKPLKPVIWYSAAGTRKKMKNAAKYARPRALPRCSVELELVDTVHASIIAKKALSVLQLVHRRVARIAYTFHDPQSSSGRNACSSKLGTKHRCHFRVTSDAPPASRSETVRPRAHFVSTAAATWCSAKETASAATRMYRMCDHHADELFLSELCSLLNMASGDAGSSGGSLCAWRFGGDLALDSKRVNAGLPHASRWQGAHAADAAASMLRRRDRGRNEARSGDAVRRRARASVPPARSTEKEITENTYTTKKTRTVARAGSSRHVAVRKRTFGRIGPTDPRKRAGVAARATSRQT